VSTTETAAQAQQFADNARIWDTAWVDRDFDSMLSIYSDDVQWQDAMLPRPLRGKSELRAYFDAMLRAFPDIEIAQEQLFSPSEGNPSEHASRWRLRGTFRGAFEVPGISATAVAPTGDRVDFTGFANITVDEDGRAKHVRQYVDETTFQRQIGMMPPAGSRSERFLMRLQALGARRRLKRNGG